MRIGPAAWEAEAGGSSPRVLFCKTLCWLGVHTKLSINTVTSWEWGLSKEGWSEVTQNGISNEVQISSPVPGTKQEHTSSSFLSAVSTELYTPSSVTEQDFLSLPTRTHKTPLRDNRTVYNGKENSKEAEVHKITRYIKNTQKLVALIYIYDWGRIGILNKKIKYTNNSNRF